MVALEGNCDISREAWLPSGMEGSWLGADFPSLGMDSLAKAWGGRGSRCRSSAEGWENGT